MGHREDLLAGAKRCLYEKGYARTTARDIVAASGTNLASIGYHYGSKEALMNAALIDAVGDFARALEEAEAKADDTPPGSLERFRAAWQRIIEVGAVDPKLWAANFELLAQVAHNPELRESFRDVQGVAREGLAEGFQDLAALGPEKAWKVGTVYHAMLIGVMAQWLIAPELAPSADDLADGLRIIMENAS